MANIGATKAFYKVETFLTRANRELSKSLECLATGKANANPSIKGAYAVMDYLETGMRVLDSASVLLSRLQELAVLGANDTNTVACSSAIDAEAEAIADEFHRLMSTSTYKGRSIFLKTADGEYVSMGGRDAEMTFGIQEVEYQEMYIHGETDYSEWEAETKLTNTDPRSNKGSTTGGLVTDIVMKGALYEVVATITNADDIADITSGADTIGEKFTANGTGALQAGTVKKVVGQLRYTASEGKYTDNAGDGRGDPQSNLLTTVITNVQAKVNTARERAGSQYAALESAVNYTLDLTARYELGYNTVNDVNFSMETAHMAKNQILKLQRAATAVLAQANQGQQGLLQLIQ